MRGGPGVESGKMYPTRRDAFQMVNGERLGEPESIMVAFPTLTRLEKYREVGQPTKFNEDIKIAQFIAGPHLYSDMLEAASNSGDSAILITELGSATPIENTNGDAPENEAISEFISKCKT